MKTNIKTKNYWTLGALFFTAVGFSSITNAALIGRLAATPGGTDYQAYYDTDANLTWLANPGGAEMSWLAAKNYAANLTVGGISGWRLPTTVDVANPGLTYSNYYQGVDAGYNITVPSEMSNMFFNVLGNAASYNTSGVSNACRVSGPYDCLTNTGPFTFPSLNSSFWNDGGYWSGTVDAQDASQAWSFGMLDGFQTYAGKNMPNHFAWAVHSGDVKPPAPPVVSAVPVPAAIWLFGSGLVGFIGLAKRKTPTLAA